MKTMPYFALFADDWLSSASVSRMTLAEQGAFLRLLCYSWSGDGIPNDRRELALLIGMPSGMPETESLLTRVIALAWKPDPDDPRVLRNDRQEAERSKARRLYDLRVAQMAHARAANPLNGKGINRKSKRLNKDLGKRLPDNQNHTLLREEAALSSEPEQQQLARRDALPGDWERIKDELRRPAPRGVAGANPAPTGEEGK
jgi:uncharacterized protein YdaU (DUF1376 family)